MHYEYTCNRRAFLRHTAQAGAVAVGLSAGVRTLAEPERAESGLWELGCYTRPWGREAYQVALDAIVEAGYKNAGLINGRVDDREGLLITWQTPIEEARKIGEACRERHLAVPSLYGGGIPVNESLEAGIEAMRKLLDNCDAAGVANLLMGGTGDADLQDTYYKAIAETCDYAAEKGIGISVKPHGGLNATGAQCRDIVRQVNHDNFRIWYDPGNIFYYSDGALDPVDDAPDVNGLVVGMSIKDYEHPKKVDVTPGKGLVDFPAVMKRLKAGGFTGGPLVVETLAAGEVRETIAEAIKARIFLEELLADME